MWVGNTAHGFIVDQERNKISKSSSYEKPQTSDAYIAAQLESRPSRPEVIRRLMADVLAKEARSQTGRLFLPFDARIGRKLTDNLAVSLEIGAPIIKDYPVYDFKTQLRLNL